MNSSQRNLIDTYYRIAPHRFHYLKFILEGYDNLAVLSSVSKQSGIIRLKCMDDSLPEMLQLLTEIAPKIKRHCL